MKKCYFSFLLFFIIFNGCNVKKINPKQEKMLSKSFSKEWQGAFLYTDNWHEKQDKQANFSLEVKLFSEDKDDRSQYVNEMQLQITGIHKPYLKDHIYNDKKNTWYRSDGDEITLGRIFIKVNGKEHQLVMSNEDEQKFFKEGSLKTVMRIPPVDPSTYSYFSWIDSLSEKNEGQYIEISWITYHISEADSGSSFKEESHKCFLSQEEILRLKEIFNSDWNEQRFKRLKI